MNTQISRRDFLKLASLLSLAAIKPFSLDLATRSDHKQHFGPNILVLVFDAFSAYHASLYGYRRESTPNLARFAERACVYHEHYAGGNFTAAGTASLLTGTYPWSHRALQLFGTVAEDFSTRNIFSELSSLGYHTVAHTNNVLANALLYQFRGGIETFKWPRELCLAGRQHSSEIFDRDFNVAFTGETAALHADETLPTSLLLSMVNRFSMGLVERRLKGSYARAFPRGLPGTWGLHFLLEDVVDWLTDQLIFLPQPYFAYFHLLAPHGPYNTRREFVDIFDDHWKPQIKPVSAFSQEHSDEFLRNKHREYDEFIAYVDAEFGRLYDHLEQSGVLENTYLIVTSDHGELFERGILAHTTPAMYEPVIRVPLLISRPGQTHREDIHTSTSCVDILPTLLHATGHDIPEWCEGEILPPFVQSTEQRDRNIFSVEAKSNPKMAPLSKGTICLIRGDYKLIQYTGYDENVPPYELFDIANDPEEREELFTTKKAVASELKDILQEKLQQVNKRYLRS